MNNRLNDKKAIDLNLHDIIKVPDGNKFILEHVKQLTLNKISQNTLMINIKTDTSNVSTTGDTNFGIYSLIPTIHV